MKSKKRSVAKGNNKIVVNTRGVRIRRLRLLIFVVFITLTVLIACGKLLGPLPQKVSVATAEPTPSAAPRGSSAPGSPSASASPNASRAPVVSATPKASGVPTGSGGSAASGSPVPGGSPSTSGSPMPGSSPSASGSPMPGGGASSAGSAHPVMTEAPPVMPVTAIAASKAVAPITPVELTAKELATAADLPNKKLGWYFNRNQNHKPPTASKEINIGKYGGYYLGDTENKVVYLTFDEGYENGFTGKILDVLKEKEVKAAFFLTEQYIKDNKELSARIAREGHVAGNHTSTHPSLPDVDSEVIIKELNKTAQYFKEATGFTIDSFMRPPMGEYSERTLWLTNELGYKTIFWSFAYQDWLVDKQPGKDVAYKTVMDNLHNGSIILLHAVSQSNTEALPDIIDSVRKQGYEFKTLYDLP